MRFALPEGLGAVSGAVLGGSWAPSWPVLGANLEPSWLPREHQKRTKMILKIERFLDTLWHLLFPIFHGFGVPTWAHVGTQEGEKSVVKLKTPICIWY